MNKSRPWPEVDSDGTSEIVFRTQSAFVKPGEYLQVVEVLRRSQFWQNHHKNLYRAFLWGSHFSLQVFLRHLSTRK